MSSTVSSYVVTRQAVGFGGLHYKVLYISPTKLWTENKHLDLHSYHLSFLQSFFFSSVYRMLCININKLVSIVDWWNGIRTLILWVNSQKYYLSFSSQ